MRKISVFLIFLSLSGFACFGQGNKPDKPSADTLPAQKKSLNIYERLQQNQPKSRFKRQLSRWIIKKPKSKLPGRDSLPEFNFRPYSQDIIRNIQIRSMDPLGYSLDDPDRSPQKWYSRAGNALHVKSKNSAIRKFFLFKPGAPLDPLKILETERLLRSQNYVRDVKITPETIDGDSVDLMVDILDSWSIVPRFSLSNTHTRIGLKERNFMGIGHEAEFVYGKRITDGSNSILAAYKIPNIRNTFIDVTARYNRDFDHYFDRFIYVNRSFYSPLTRWAGGALLQERSLERPMVESQDKSVSEFQNLKYRYQNYWGGLSFRILKGNSNIERTTNLIVSLRTLFLDYKQLPRPEFNPLNYFADEQFYLAGIGIASRQYVRDDYIFRDGETEDVPVGTVHGITLGLQHKDKQERFYIGFRSGYGTYLPFGFISLNMEAGSFVTHSRLEQATINLKVNYFSNLIQLGPKWRMRQFIKPQVVIGFNRLDTPNDRIGLNEDPYFRGVNNYEYLDYGNKQKYIDYKNGNIEGFKSLAQGKRKYILDLQTQMYSPWTVLGFHLNPFLNMNLAYLAGQPGEYGSNRFYSSFGVGFIIRNDFLVFDLFQLSLSYYPDMPGRPDHLFKANSLKSEDFGFQDFSLDEPRPVIYE